MRLTVSVVVWLTGVAAAQTPRLHGVVPPGGRAGTTVAVAVRGTDLDGATLRFSHPGLTAAVGDPFRVAVAADVPPGGYDVRAVTPAGVSNPRTFVVGSLPEVGEAEPNDDVPLAQRISIGSVVNGVVASSADVDYVAFAGTKGQRVLAHAAATSIDSKAKLSVELFGPDGKRVGQNRGHRDGDALADVTLPADGDYHVRVTEFAHTQGGPDHFYRLTLTAGPWADAVFPPAVEPGKPSVVTVFGRGLPGGTPSKLTADGRPADALAVTVTPLGEPVLPGRVAPPAAFLDGFAYRLPGTNPVPVFLAREPVVVEKETGNDAPEKAEPVAVPCEVCGRIDRPGDRDWFAFPARKGERLVIELVADRAGAAFDPYLVVRDPQRNATVASDEQLDDDADPLHPQQFFTRSADPPPFLFDPPADGTYQVMVGGRDGSAGVRCGYRLRVARPRPDFGLVVLPHGREPAAGVLRGGEVAYDVLLHRADGFDGPVEVTAANLPAGVTARPTLIGPGQRGGTLVLAGAAAPGEYPFRVVGTATIDGTPIAREARPAGVTWAGPANQAVPLVARLERSLLLAVRPGKPVFRLGTDAAATVKPGGTFTLPVSVDWLAAEPRTAPLTVRDEPTHPNPKITLLTTADGKPVAVPPDSNRATVTLAVRPDAPPGRYAVTLRGEMLAADKKTVAAAAHAGPVFVTVTK